MNHLHIYRVPICGRKTFFLQTNQIGEDSFALELKGRNQEIWIFPGNCAHQPSSRKFTFRAT